MEITIEINCQCSGHASECDCTCAYCSGMPGETVCDRFRARREATFVERAWTDLRALDLRDQGVDGAVAYRVIVDGGDDAEILFLPALGRAGVAWGSDAVWTDCSSAEEAWTRYVTDRMVA